MTRAARPASHLTHHPRWRGTGGTRVCFFKAKGGGGAEAQRVSEKGACPAGRGGRNNDRGSEESGRQYKGGRSTCCRDSLDYPLLLFLCSTPADHPAYLRMSFAWTRGRCSFFSEHASASRCASRRATRATRRRRDAHALCRRAAACSKAQGGAWRGVAVTFDFTKQNKRTRS